MAFNFKERFKSKFFAGLVAGFCDEVRCYNDLEIKDADLSRSMIDKCMPPSKWFSEEDYGKAIYFLKKKDVSRTLKNLVSNSPDAQKELCVAVFQAAFLKVIMGAPKLLSDSLPTTYM